VERGWRVSLIALSGNGGDAANNLMKAGVAFHSLEMRKGLADPRGWLRLHAWIQRNHPDVVHTHLPHASLLARCSRVASSVRVLVDTIHSPAICGRARQIGYQLTSRQTDAVTAVSHAAADPWLQSGLISPRTLTILPNGIDTDLWKHDKRSRVCMRNKLGLSDEFLWLAVGRLDPVKDHTTLLRGFALLSPNARLMILGSGPLEGKLRTLATELGLLQRVSFPGFQTNILQWMQAADGFVLCSRWEGLPISLLEACACEIPAVITDNPGAREVLPLALHPLAVSVADPESLAAAMNDLILKPEAERRELGRRTRSSIRERFSMDQVLIQWENLFLNLLAENPQSSRFGRPASASGGILQLR
jgi:glycosyltransferase involved in cell wall biosynthesis